MYYNPAIVPAVVFRDFLAMELLPLGLLLRFMIHVYRALVGKCYWKPLSAKIGSDEVRVQQYQRVMNIVEVERPPPVSR